MAAAVAAATGRSSEMKEGGLSPILKKQTDLSASIGQSTALKAGKRSLVDLSLTPGINLGRKMEAVGEGEGGFVNEELSDEKIQVLSRMLMARLGSADIIINSRNNVSIPKHVDSKYNKYIFFVILF